MSIACYPWSLRSLVDRQPTVGALMDLCEENYQTMMTLAPGLRLFRGRFLSRVEDSMDLYLEILEQTPYTTLIHLTYYFQHHEGQRPDPDATFRAYHDASQVEIFTLKQSVLPLNRGMEHPTLEQKWKANLFASKWLGYCVRQRHRFGNQNTVGVVRRENAAIV